VRPLRAGIDNKSRFDRVFKGFGRFASPKQHGCKNNGSDISHDPPNIGYACSTVNCQEKGHRPQITVIRMESPVKQASSLFESENVPPIQI
jgi:hypothetical protein